MTDLSCKPWRWCNRIDHGSSCGSLAKIGQAGSMHCHDWQKGRFLYGVSKGQRERMMCGCNADLLKLAKMSMINPWYHSPFSIVQQIYCRHNLLRPCAAIRDCCAALQMNADCGKVGRKRLAGRNKTLLSWAGPSAFQCFSGISRAWRCASPTPVTFLQFKDFMNTRCFLKICAVLLLLAEQKRASLGSLEIQMLNG